MKSTSKPTASPTLHTPCWQRIASPLGDILLAATPLGLCGLWFDGQKHLPDMSAWPTLASGATGSREAAHIAQAVQQIGAYFAGRRQAFDVPLDLSRGTDFQQSVWRALLRITSGDHSSYSAIAQQIRKPQAVRAVGAAVGRNPVSIIVPCHRVLGADGTLTGYAGGLDRKTALLRLEGVLLA
jgi:methylated-DNA-[protein]-cysteine S-methyltransferase